MVKTKKRGENNACAILFDISYYSDKKGKTRSLLNGGCDSCSTGTLLMTTENASQPPPHPKGSSILMGFEACRNSERKECEICYG